MWMWIFLFMAGAAALYVGAEAFVRGSVALAMRFKIPILIIGLTLVALGTSAPELFINIRSALMGIGDLGVGNVVGANILTVGGLLGICSLMKPLQISSQLLRWDMPAMIATNLLMMAFTYSGEIGRFKGGLFLSLLFVYFFVLYVITKKGIFKEDEVLLEEKVVIEKIKSISRYLWWDCLLIIGGIILLVVGSQWLMKGAIELARIFQVTEAVIGLSIVALGTSMPEIITSLIAIYRRQPHIAVGNIIGSNIYNLIGILGVSSLFRPLQLQHAILRDLTYLLALQCLLFPFLQKRSEIPRWKGGCLLFLYLLYVAILYMNL